MMIDRVPRLPTWPPGCVGGLSLCTDGVKEGGRGFLVRVLGDQFAPERFGEDGLVKVVEER
jgi:hypothetical protein